jgi:hypothetical protein
MFKIYLCKQSSDRLPKYEHPNLRSLQTPNSKLHTAVTVIFELGIAIIFISCFIYKQLQSFRSFDTMFSLKGQKNEDPPETIKLVFKEVGKVASEEKNYRETIIKTQSIEPKVFSPVLLNEELNLSDLEDFLEETNGFSLSEKESCEALRALYPPQHANFSSLVITQNFSKFDGNKDSAMFLELLRNAYANDIERENGINAGIMRCNVVLKDITQIHSFEFEKERDYWSFISCIKTGIKGESTNLKGKCKYISRNQPHQTSSERKLDTREKLMMRNRFSLKTNLSLNTTTFNDSVEAKSNTLSVTTIANDDFIIHFEEIVALALTLDHREPLSDVMLIGLGLPGGFVNNSTKSEKDSLVIQFASTTDKRIVHAAEQFDPKSLPFHNGFSIENHRLAVVPLESEILYNPPRVDSTSLRSGMSSVVHSDNSEFKFKATIKQKVHWEVEIYDDLTNGKLLGKKAVQYNPFLEGNSQRYSEENPKADISPFSLGRTRSLRLSLSPARNKDAGNEGSSPVPSPKRYSSMMSDLKSNQNIIPSRQVLKYKEQRKMEIEILEKQFNKALRVYIKYAEGLSGAERRVSPPSAYCTVYLVGKNQEKLTSNHAEIRTEGLKSFSPEWNKEIILQDNKLGIDEVHGVMVLIRDGSSGILKHKHIGQILIPIGCFLQDEASFCLPLEPSYR